MLAVTVSAVFAYGKMWSTNYASSESGLTTSVSNSTTTSAFTYSATGSTVGLTSSQANCPVNENASITTSNGLALLTCFKTGLKLGDQASLHGIIRNDVSDTGAYVTIANMTITDSNGKVVFQEILGPSQNLNLSQGQAYEFNVIWSTGDTFNGIAPTIGVHHVYLSIGGLSSETDFTLSG